MFRSRENQHHQQELIDPLMTRYNSKSREVLLVVQAATGDRAFQPRGKDRGDRIETVPWTAARLTVDGTWVPPV